MPTLIRSLIKNGKTPIKVSEIGTFFAILLIIKTFKPTGGVISPTSTTIRVRIPNQIATSSILIPKSNSIMMGKNTGIVSSIIAKLSIRQPKRMYRTNIQNTTRYGESSLLITNVANSLVICVSAMKELKNSAPNNTKKIIADVTAVSLITSIKSLKLKPFVKSAIIPVPAAPIEAPSVGVNHPR